MLDEKAVKVIEDILSRGGSVEIRKRKEYIVIIEVTGKTKYTITDG